MGATRWLGQGDPGALGFHESSPLAKRSGPLAKAAKNAPGRPGSSRAGREGGGGGPDAAQRAGRTCRRSAASMAWRPLVGHVLGQVVPSAPPFRRERGRRLEVSVYIPSA